MYGALLVQSCFAFHVNYVAPLDHLLQDMTDLILSELHEGVSVLKLNRGPVSVMLDAAMKLTALIEKRFQR